MRLVGYDYSKEGIYFVSNVVQNRLCLLGWVINDRMILSDAGKMVEKWYFKIEEKFSGVKCHDYVIMPNHYHFLIEILPHQESIDDSSIVGADPSVRPKIKPNLSEIIQWFKTMTSNEYIRMVFEKGWRRFNKRLWQKSFYDKIMRGFEIDGYKTYIANNPKNWKEEWR